MKTRIITSLLSAVCLSTGSASADDTKSMDTTMQEMAKKYQAAATPGTPHKLLAEMSGNWKTVSKMWESPDAQPMTSKGNAKLRMILGGRWLQQDFKGTNMGQPFEGIGFFGYDNVKGKYVSHWIDSMSTGSMQAEGDYESSSKTFKDEGSMSCPLSSTKKQEIRTEWQMISKNKLVFSMFGGGPAKGPEFKMMEITYSR